MNKLETTKKYWSDGSGYDAYIQDELSSFRKSVWKKQVLSHFSLDKKPKILDIGTGPGFFACILSEEGHQVVGIDNSVGMLSCAKKNEREYFEKYGKEFVVCSYDEGYKEYYESLPLSNILFQTSYVPSGT